MSLRDEVKYTLIAGAVGLAGILGLGAGSMISQYPLYVPSRHTYERKVEPRQETKTIYIDSRGVSLPATHPATTQCESDPLEVICSEEFPQAAQKPAGEESREYVVPASPKREQTGTSFYAQFRAIEDAQSRKLEQSRPTELTIDASRALYHNLKRQDARGVDLFDKLEDVIYRMAHDDRRALRDTYAHLHPLTIQGYAFNPNMHEGPQAREMSRYIVRKMIDNFSCNEQRTLAGILGQAGYHVNSTDELMTAVSDLYAIFGRNIRDDKDYHAAMLMKQVGAAALIGYGVGQIGKGHKDPTPSGIHGGNITDGDRVGPR